METKLKDAVGGNTVKDNIFFCYNLHFPPLKMLFFLKGLPMALHTAALGGQLSIVKFLIEGVTAELHFPPSQKVWF